MTEKKSFLYIMVLIVGALAFLGAGLGVLFNSKGEVASFIGGFVLIGLALAFVYKLLMDVDGI